MTIAPNGKALQLKSYAQMLVLSLLVVLSAILIGLFLNSLLPLPALLIDLLEFTGYILWGTGLARPKVDIVHHCIPSKMFYRRLQLLSSQFGIFAFVLARTLIPLE